MLKSQGTPTIASVCSRFYGFPHPCLTWGNTSGVSAIRKLDRLESETGLHTYARMRVKMFVEYGDPKFPTMALPANKAVGFVSTSLTREYRATIAMDHICFRDHHPTVTRLCAECEQFLTYANKRLERCLFGAKKPMCPQYHVHCHKPAHRAQVRTIMTYAGPRLLW
jgi:hypothetical protein